MAKVTREFAEWYQRILRVYCPIPPPPFPEDKIKQEKKKPKKKKK